MSNSKHLTSLTKWMTNVSVYPPAELYFGSPKSQEKKEKRCKEICESLYRFNWEGAKYPNPIGTVREIINEMTIVDRMFEYNHFPPKRENVVSLVAKLVTNGYNLISELEKMHKQNQKMSEWYSNWSLPTLRLRLLAVHWGADILRLSSGSQEISDFCDSVENKIKEMSK